MQLATRHVRIRRGGAWRTVSAITLLFGSVLAVGGLRVLLAAPQVFLVGVLLMLPTLVRRHAARPRADLAVQATPERLVVDDLRLNVRDLAGAWAADPQTLVVQAQNKTEIVVTLMPGSTAQQALEALGYDLRKQTLRAPLRGSIGAFTQGFLTFIGTMLLTMGTLTAQLGPLGLLLAFVLSVVLTVFVVWRFGSPRVVIGTDGLRLEGGLRTRFVPFSKITRVQQLPDVSVTLDSGDEIALPTIGQSAAQVAALAARIEAGRAAFGESTARGMTQLERSGRDLATWRSEVRALVTQEAGFRQLPLTPADLEAELRDASAPAERRIGAALALASVDPQRIRLAAETCADDRLRIALEAVLEDSLDEEKIDAVAATRF